ncbi:MAG: hypothetical protein R2730_02365 [Chitinophagales bacterium]
MKSAGLYSILIAYTFIFIGLGILLEVLIKMNVHVAELKIPLRYFYWAMNGITLTHLLLLLFYKVERNEQKRSRLMFFSVINHFIVSLIAITLYAFLWWEGIQAEALISVVLYMITFVFFITVVLKESKK